MIKFYCYSKCGTCKRAETYLKEHDIPYESIDISSSNFTKADISKLHVKSKKDIRKLFNTSGNVYKELNLKDKLNRLSLDECYELLTNGMLIKRPILVQDEKALFGFNQLEYEEVVKNARRS
jgi:arsenate reductase